jgi:hypothetical protein
MLSPMYNHWLFIHNVLAHLVASMSGVASFLFATWEHAKKKKLEARIFFIVGMFCLIIAFDQAWQDEHGNVKVLVGEKAALWQERDFWKIQTYDKDAALRSRDQLLAQNYTALIGEQTTANGSQQSLAQLSNKILDISKPEPQEFSMRTDAVEYPPISQGQRVSEFVMTTNKPITANIVFSCDHAIPYLSAHIAGGGPHFPNSVERIYDNSWGIHIPSPMVTPQSPLIIVVVSGTAPGTLERCGYQKQ